MMGLEGLGAIEGDDRDAILLIDRQHTRRPPSFRYAPPAGGRGAGKLAELCDASVKIAARRHRLPGRAGAAKPPRPSAAAPATTECVDVLAREILERRGNPTGEVDVVLEDGSM